MSHPGDSSSCPCQVGTGGGQGQPHSPPGLLQPPVTPACPGQPHVPPTKPLHHLWVFSLPEARWQLTKPKEVPLKRKETPTAPLFPAGMCQALSSGEGPGGAGMAPRLSPHTGASPPPIPIPTQCVGDPSFHAGGVDVADAPFVLGLHQHHDLDAPEALQGDLRGGWRGCESACSPHGQARWGWRSSKVGQPIPERWLLGRALPAGSPWGIGGSLGCIWDGRRPWVWG